MIQIRELTMVHRRDQRTLLADFSLTLREGERAVLVGEEGDGKSTLLKWIADPSLVDEYVQCTGERILSAERPGYLPQELPAAERERTVYEFFCEQERFWDQTPGDLSGYARRFSLPVEFFYGQQTMGSLSGGERVRAQLMRVLMGEPTVLLLDEPSNDVDEPTLEVLEEVIGSWPGAVLFVSHDETLIAHTANVIVLLEQLRGRGESRWSVCRQSWEEFVSSREQAFARQAQQAANERRALRSRQEKYHRVHDSVEHALRAASRQNPAAAKNLKDKMHAVKAMGRRLQRESGEMTQMPEREEAIYLSLGGQGSAVPAGKTVIDFSLPELIAAGSVDAGGGRVLARDVHLLVRGSEKVCITGRNGAGKTTLLRKIARELQGREDLSVEVMPQDYAELLDPALSPVEYLCPSGERSEETRVRTYLGSLKFTREEMERPMGELSGGQRAKVLLLQLSLSTAQVLILDEPTRNVSPLSAGVVLELLENFPGAILSVSHDRRYIERVCERVLELTELGLVEREV